MCSIFNSRNQQRGSRKTSLRRWRKIKAGTILVRNWSKREEMRLRYRQELSERDRFLRILKSMTIRQVIEQKSNRLSKRWWNLISSVWNTHYEDRSNAFNAYQYYIYAEDEKSWFRNWREKFAFEEHWLVYAHHHLTEDGEKYSSVGLTVLFEKWRTTSHHCRMTDEGLNYWVGGVSETFITFLIP